MVDYVSIEGLPGARHFRCQPLRALLSAEACAGFWRRANHDGDPARHTCRRCPIGAAHAGEDLATTSPLYGTLTCARCHRGAERLVGKTLCVSCYNRQREAIRGRNAKGTRPVKLPPLQRRRIWFMAGRDLRDLAAPLTLDTTELVVAALRDSRERVLFAFRAQPAGPAQLRLF